ncbi:MAG: hypothetical protein ABSE08_17250 [Syntrophobacteraceae bacterium]
MKRERGTCIFSLDLKLRFGADIQAPLTTLTGVREENLRGVTGLADGVFGREKAFADKKIIVHKKKRD